jgi:nitroreductase
MDGQGAGGRANDVGSRLLNDLSSPLALLESRRSGKPREMISPGPSPRELERILQVAARVPDHGRIAPWRFVIIEDRVAFAALLDHAYRTERPSEPGRAGTRADAAFAQQAPLLIVAISAPTVDSKITVWEQQLSMGAAVLNLQLAAIAQGYVAGWLTGWAAYSPTVAAALSVGPNDRIAGFIFIGSPGNPLKERPRPSACSVSSRWPLDIGKAN